MAALFLAAFGLGIAFSAPPGVVTALAVQRGLAHGFGAALSVELGSLIGGGDAHPRPAHYVAFFSGFMAAAFLWCFFLSALVTWGRRFVTPRFFRWVSLGCGVALSYFAARLLWTALTNATALL